MNFAEFFYTEIFDPLTGEAKGELKRYSSDDYEYKFEIGRDSYKVTFEKGGTSWGISFSGPRGYGLTGQGIGPSVYGEMLAGIKKFIDEVKPEKLSFSGASSEMDLMYDKFMKKYLGDAPGKPADQVFIRYSSSNYIRKDVYESLPDYQKARIDGAIATWGQEQEEYFRERRADKQRKREMYMKVASYIGGFIMHGWGDDVGLIFKVTPDKIQFLTTQWDGRVYPDSARTRDYIRQDTDRLFTVHDLHRLPKDKLTSLLDKIFDPKNAEISKYLNLIPKNVLETIKSMYFKLSRDPQRRAELTRSA